MDTESFYFVYVLFSERDKKFYVGFTSKLNKRVQTHQRGLVEATRSRLPLRLVFYEAYLNKYDALRREGYLKSTKGKQTMRNMLKEYLKTYFNRTGKNGSSLIK